MALSLRKAACVLLFAGALVPAAGVAPKRALRKPKAALPQVDIGSLIANSQRGLAKAEARHKRAIAHARKKLSALLLGSGKTLGTAVGHYVVALETAAASLKDAAELARAVANDDSVPASSAAPKKDQKKEMSWGGEDMELRAKLRAKADATDREAGKLSRRSARATREGTQDAMAALEDSVRALSRKVGDVTSVLDDAHAALDHAAASQPKKAAAAIAAKPKTLAEAEAGLAKAVTASHTEVAAAEGKFSKDLAGETHAVVASMDAIAHDLDHPAPKAAKVVATVAGAERK